MNRQLTLFGLILLASVSARAQSLDDYLHLRRSYKIIEAAGEPALETLVGTRIFEIQGIVKGTFSVGGSASLLLEKPDGDTQVIDAPNMPNWAFGNDAPCRLIVRASRPTENSELQATLLAVAREEDIAPVEAAALAAIGRAAKAHAKKTLRSRAGLEPDPSLTGRVPVQQWDVPNDARSPGYAAFIKRKNPRLSDAAAYRMADSILGFARMYGVDAKLIVAMVICESDFNPNEVSHSGAMGLGQLMPETVKDYGISDPFDSAQNLYGTVREIRSHLDKYQNETGDSFQALVLGLAAYNAGEGAVRRHGGVPPYRETQNYVRRVINLYRQLSKK